MSESKNTRNIVGKLIDFREIAVQDASFVLSLRLDPALNQYLSITDPDLEKQKKWIQHYLNNNTQEWYFIIQNKQLEPVGTIRIYDIRGDSFCWGSWIVLPAARHYATLESIVLLFDYAFFTLGFNRTHFETRVLNKNAVNFYARFGARIVNQDDLNYYYAFEKIAYQKDRKKYFEIIDENLKKYGKTND